MKDYKKILEGVVEIINTTEKSDIGFANICSYMGENCPELKKNEDEKIKRCISDVVRKYGKEFTTGAVTKEKMLAWLEKHGEQKSFNYKNQETKNGHKFNIGDIISNGKVVYRVDGITKNCLTQDCYFLVNIKSEKNGTRYLILHDSYGKTSYMGEITWLCEQVDKLFEKR